MTYPVEGLGIVSAVDSTLVGMDRTRFMGPNKSARWCAGFFTVVTATSVKIRPVYVREVDKGSGQSWTDMPRHEDTTQEVTFTAAGDYTCEFRARPGFRMGFRVQTLNAGTVEISGEYLTPLGP